MTVRTNKAKLAIGIDIGSTTTKIVVIENDKVIFEKYERHLAQVRQKTYDLLCEAEEYIGSREFYVSLSGSAGMGLATQAEIPFVQEVFATGEVIKQLEPDTTTVIELGGEDAKIIFFDGGTDERMNGTCAGGTGAFIDQMASLLNVTPDELDELSLNYKRLYPIASRCGVFAKTDIQPLLNQGARKEDISASIYQAVVNQTIAGLSQGRKITGKVLFLGGPLYYCKGLQERFKATLKLSDENAVFPEYARFAVAMGAALYAEKCDIVFNIEELKNRVKSSVKEICVTDRLNPLFETEEDFEKFKERHKKACVNHADINEYTGKAWLGIDCGSTTTKAVLISENKEILYTFYSSNKGNPVEIIKNVLTSLYEKCEDRIKICGSAVTGYGEELIKHAFGVDIGVVETIAHYTAAKFFLPEVDFILDIGGQDIKCFKIRNNAIDSIMLNEACSSGCGSFLETFATSMGYSVEDFAKAGLKGKSPVNLGTRCTVFMNSSVKQSQKDGATVEDISAGLSISVVKNAIYKVIRAGSADELGENVVVQGGTFYNDAVLRAFEIELGKNVVRPEIAGLMGAYGAAICAMKVKSSKLITKDELLSFEHTSKPAVCKGCTNNCHLTINTFSGGKRLVSGNQCEKGAGIAATSEKLPNVYEDKRNYLESFGDREGIRGKIGLPLSLGMYELLPFWYTLFSKLGFGITVSKMSTRRTYEKGQFTIPSDTACYPAKIMHGHVIELLEKGVDAVFYPCLTYNVDEKLADNHYNCPVVAYYSELLKGNMEELQDVKFMYPYLNINSEKELVKELYAYLPAYFDGISKKEIKEAVKAAYSEYDRYMKYIKRKGEEALSWAREHSKRVMILAGRPYHIDKEINHGIDKLASSLDFVVVSEDSVYHLSEKQNVNVLNQWTYHARLYMAADFAARNDDVQFVQLISFGCGVDAITTDEVRAILESREKIYTQIKIDEITNLGAVKIRLRSLLGAIQEKESKKDLA